MNHIERRDAQLPYISDEFDEEAWADVLRIQKEQK